MSINWVMLDPTAPTRFTPLPHEQTLYTSPARTSLTLSSLNPFPGSQPFSLSSAAGTFYLTNQRIIFLPASSSFSSSSPPSLFSSPVSDSTGSTTLKSFAAPILNLENSRLSMPWIGPNVWTVLVKPVSGGGLPVAHERLELKITFRDGGAYDFQSRFERIKERVVQVSEVMREGNVGAGGAAGGCHLEELPAYPGAPGEGVGSNGAERIAAAGGADSAADARIDSTHRDPPPPPDGPPPGYDEVQRLVVQDELVRHADGERR